MIYFGSTKIEDKIYFGGTLVSEIYLGDTLVWPENTGLPIGTTYNFEYTGNVQSIELPKGTYKLQCWGAQGGTSYGSSSGVGSKGGYSEGVLTLDNETTLYVFVGGKGSRGSSTSLVNGGWNGGGASVGYSEYDNSGWGESKEIYGYSYPACGGGATDICTVTSSMSYSGGITNRSSESLLSRIIVAGGGAGGSYRHTEETVYEEVTTGDWVTKKVNGSGTSYSDDGYTYGSIYGTFDEEGISLTITNTGTVRIIVTFYSNTNSNLYLTQIDAGSSIVVTTPTGMSWIQLRSVPTGDYTNGEMSAEVSWEVYEETTDYIPSTSTSSDASNQSQQGGGTSGCGLYPGTVSSGGDGGGFGYGASQKSINYRYCSGAGGGGWYGGGSGRSDSSVNYINYSGGGSGFVNISANSSYLPSGYTGLQLDSGATYAGNTSFTSTSGGTETGHSGNGYAKITVLESGSSGGSGGSGGSGANITWETQSGTWTPSTNDSAKDGKQWTCTSPGSNGSTVIRCTFSGITSITFNCVYQGENNYDYLTVGELDSSCSRSSYKTSLKGKTGTALDITYSCDSGTHYVEFCYSKDGSVDTSPDNATVYVKSYS